MSRRKIKRRNIPEKTEYKTPDDYLRHVNSLCYANNFREALALCEECVRNYLGHTEARMALSMIYHKLGRLQEAITTLQETVDLGEEDPRILSTLAQLYVQQKQPEKALEVYEKFFRAVPPSARNLFNAAKALSYECKAYDAALQLYKRALQVASDAHEITSIRVAVIECLNVLERNEEGVEACDEFLATHGELSTGEIGTFRTRMLVKLGRMEEPLHLESPQDFINASQKAFKQGNFTEAEAILRDGLEITPDEAELNMALGYCLFNQQKPREAVKYFEKVADIKPKDASAQVNLGVIYYETQQPEKSKAALLEAIKLQPDLQILTIAGNLLFESGDFEEALDAYKGLLELETDNEQRLNVQKHICQCLHTLGRYEEALEVCEAMLEQKPEFPPILGFKIGILYAMGRKEEAMKIQESLGDCIETVGEGVFKIRPPTKH